MSIFLHLKLTIGKMMDCCKCRDRVFDLLAALNHVKFLSIFAKCLRYGYFHPSSFQNLVRLDFKINDCSWHVLKSLLHISPNLEILVVTKEQPKYPFHLSSHLTSVCYGGFEGLEYELEFIECTLKTMKVQVSDGELKESVLEELSMFPRCSKTCLLTFE
ncbi:hypothetical protein CFP56_032775 [Quercus suber]|uniref:FBD domain-containing protein n=1 Tax=Quercus suber TaxID=58331 RepID=A0AAW0JFP7_QUESU